MANLDKGLLENNKVPCMLENENTVNVNELWTYAVGNVGLMVLEEDRGRALSILRGDEVLDTQESEQENESENKTVEKWKFWWIEYLGYAISLSSLMLLLKYDYVAIPPKWVVEIVLILGLVLISTGWTLKFYRRFKK